MKLTFAELVQQRDELLKALRACRKALDDASTDSEEADNQGFFASPYDAALESAAQAIASAEATIPTHQTGEHHD